MYTKKQRQSSLNLLKLLQSFDNEEISYSQAAHKLELSRRSKDKQMEEERYLQQMCSNSSLTRSDVLSKTWQRLNIDDRSVRNYARSVSAWDPDTCKMGLFLHGKPGCGKTHMLKALILDNCSSYRSWKFLSVADFMNELKRFDTEYRLVERMNEQYFGIVLDDLGTEKASNFEQQELFRLLEGRKKLDKPVFMTSNLSLPEMENKYHSRIVSRFKEHMVFIEVKTDDYREKINSDNVDMYREKVRLLPRNN